MGASNSRAGGRRGGRGGVGGQRVARVGLPPPHHLQKHHQHDLRRSGAPQPSPRRVVPVSASVPMHLLLQSDINSGDQNSPLNSDKIQQLDQGQLSVVPAAEALAPPERMMASVKDGGNSIEETVTSQMTQAVKALCIASDAATEPVVDCASEAAAVHDKPEGNDSALHMIEEEEDACPICLEGFDEENPKLVIQCEHEYHLACILDWMERNATCPICCQVALFDEPL